MFAKKIDYFMAVAEQGSILGAAKILSITASPISKKIQELEKELGYRLFYRRSAGLSLTVQGSELYDTVTYIKNKLSKMKGGSSVIVNLQSLCPSINRSITSSLESFYSGLEVEVTMNKVGGKYDFFDGHSKTVSYIACYPKKVEGFYTLYIKEPVVITHSSHLERSLVNQKACLKIIKKGLNQIWFEDVYKNVLRKDNEKIIYINDFSVFKRLIYDGKCISLLSKYQYEMFFKGDRFSYTSTQHYAYHCLFINENAAHAEELVGKLLAKETLPWRLHQ